jgi:hypothetical protein
VLREPHASGTTEFAPVNFRPNMLIDTGLPWARRKRHTCTEQLRIIVSQQEGCGTGRAPKATFGADFHVSDSSGPAIRRKVVLELRLPFTDIKNGSEFRSRGFVPDLSPLGSLTLRRASRITALVFALISSKISSVLTRLA